jgi:hypothetical protein
MNTIYEHDHSSEWKEAMDAISQYFNGLVDMLTTNIAGYCKLKSAFEKGWNINQLIAQSNSSQGLSEIDDSFWWNEWIGLLSFLEDEFDINFPQKEDFEEIYYNGYVEKIQGINYNLTIDKLAEIISLLLSDEELPREFFLYEVSPIDFEDNLLTWSDSLKSLTKEVLRELPIPSFMKGYCVLKSLGRKHGKISLEDAIAYRWQIKDIETDELIVSFDSLDELIDAGWVVD